MRLQISFVRFKNWKKNNKNETPPLLHVPPLFNGLGFLKKFLEKEILCIILIVTKRITEGVDFVKDITSHMGKLTDT